MGEIIRTQDITPDSLEAALDLFVSENVDLEDAPGVRAVLGAVKLSYRRYYYSKEVEVVVSNEDLQDSLAESLQPPLPQPVPPGPSK